MVLEKLCCLHNFKVLVVVLRLVNRKTHRFDIFLIQNFDLITIMNNNDVCDNNVVSKENVEICYEIVNNKLTRNKY